MSSQIDAALTVTQIQTGLQNTITSTDPVERINNIAQMAAGFSALLNNPAALVTANANAGLITLGKMDLDIKSGKPLNPDDLLSLAGNVLGIVGGLGVILIPAGREVGLLFKIANVFGAAGVFKYVIDNATADDFLAARGYQAPRRDPLVFDLDGDGIETVGINATNPILFDHDADGVKTGTGWIGADDGFLVLDRNGNGVIDSGRELFGDATLKSNGQLAANGFDALADLDSNGDSVVNAADVQYANLRIWRDLNQNGTSENTGAGRELFTLAELGIAGIKVVATANNQVLANRNQIADLGQFIKSDGTLGTLGSAVDVNLASSNFHSQFTTPIALTAQTASLPTMSGSGLVRNLNEAATLSSGLAAALTSLQASTTRAQFLGQLDGVIAQWAASSALNGAGLALTNSFDLALANNQRLIFIPPGVSALEAYAASIPETGITTGAPANLPVLTAERRAEILAKMAEIANLIKVLEPFEGENFIKIVNGHAEQGTVTLTTDTALGATSGSTLQAGQQWIFATLEQPRLDLLRQSYTALKDSAYQGLALQTWLKPYLDSISLNVDSITGTIKLDFTTMNALLDTRHTSDPANALTDLVELYRLTGSTLESGGWSGLQTLQTWAEAATSDAALLPVLTSLGIIAGAGTVNGTASGEFLFGQAENNTLNGNDGDDRIGGGTGDDVLYGGNGNDTLDGGAGNDTLNGGLGNDTYLFGRGDGQDFVQQTYDSAAGRLNTLQFKDGVLPGDVVLKRVYDNNYWYNNANLEVSIAGTTDKITLQGVFGNDDPNNVYNPLQQIRFADGTAWDLAAIKAELYKGSAAADALIGTTAADIMTGLAGDDTLSGRAGNDGLYGGDGTDGLYGEDGNDTLDGGAGNDYLSGGTGSDIYMFGRGSQADTLYDYDVTSGNSDKLQLGANIDNSQIWFRHVGSDLEVSLIGTADKATISNWYSGSAYHVEQFQTAGGQTLLDSQVENLVTAMAAFTPPAVGQTTLPQNYQDALAPVLAANWH